MKFFSNIKIIDVMLMVLYVSLAIGVLCSIANDDGPIQNDPDR